MTAAAQKQNFCLFDKTGRVWARARSGGANANFTPPQQAAAHVCTGIEECLRVSGVPLSEVSGIVLFIPGFHTVLPQVKEHFGRDDIRQMGDVETRFMRRWARRMELPSSAAQALLPWGKPNPADGARWRLGPAVW